MIERREGTKLILAFPEGYDKRTKIAYFNGHIVVAHPDFPPCTVEDGKLVPIEPNNASGI